MSGDKPYPSARGIPDWTDWVCWLLILAGAGLRIYLWAQNRGLWIDEAYLAVNVLERSFGELHRPLEYSQSAPWLFLIACKAMAGLFGPSEMALRAVPLAASVVSLWFFWRLARESLARWIVPVIVAVFTFGSRSLYYAQELKQYSLDILLTTLLLWLAGQMFGAQGKSARYFAWLSVFGSIGIFAMHAMPFLLAGLGGVVLWARWKGRLDIPYAWMFLAAAVWLGCFVANYLLIIRPNYTDEVMQSYWAFAYPKLPWAEGGLRTWYAAANSFLYYVGLTGVFKTVIAVLLLAGTWFASRNRQWVILIGIAALGLYWIAALAGKAPFYGRLLLFLLPALTLTVGAGLTFLTRRAHPALCALAAILVLTPTAKHFRTTIKGPETYESVRTSVLTLSQQRKLSEPVYALYWAQPGLRYYRQALRLENLSDSSVHFGRDFRSFTSERVREWTPGKVLSDLDRTVAEIEALMPETGRLWVLMSHHSIQQEAELLDKMQRMPGITTTVFHQSNKSGLLLCNR